MFSTFSSEVLTSSIGMSSSLYSRLSIWRSGERKISLNFVAESFSQRNCIGRRDNGLFLCEDLSSEMLVLKFIQVTIGLWSDNEHGCLTTKFETLGKISWSHIA